MPLIVSSWAMVEKFLRLSRVARALAKTFWPGPLSIVTDVDESISALARDSAVGWKFRYFLIRRSFLRRIMCLSGPSGGFPKPRTKDMHMQEIRGTTILAVKDEHGVALTGDGQDSSAFIIAKLIP